jgi:hypothetical protein
MTSVLGTPGTPAVRSAVAWYRLVILLGAAVCVLFVVSFIRPAAVAAGPTAQAQYGALESHITKIVAFATPDAKVDSRPLVAEPTEMHCTTPGAVRLLGVTNYTMTAVKPGSSAIPAVGLAMLDGYHVTPKLTKTHVAFSATRGQGEDQGVVSVVGSKSSPTFTVSVISPCGPQS